MKKFSIIDVAIVLVLVFAVVFLATKIVGSGTRKGEPKTIRYTAMISAADKGLYDTIKEGDIVCINDEQDRDTAKVLSVKREVAEVTTVNSDTGEHKLVKNPAKEDITVELETEVLADSIGMKNGESAVKVGMNAVIRGTGYSGKGFIIKISD